MQYTIYTDPTQLFVWNGFPVPPTARTLSNVLFDDKFQIFFSTF